MGYADKMNVREKIDSYSRWHSIDFGEGLRSVGSKSSAILRVEADAIFAPLDLHGKSVLDIGAWDGHFSFEAKKRGAARVLATDYFVWNHPELRGRETFDLARSLLNLEIEDMDIGVPDVLPEIGTFDVVLFLGVFYHLYDAPTLTKQISACASDVLVLETMHDAIYLDRPAMVFYSGATHADDPMNWWGPNHLCIYEILKECGFQRIFYTPTHKNRRNPRGTYHAFRGACPRYAHWIDLDNESQRQRLVHQPFREKLRNLLKGS